MLFAKGLAVSLPAREFRNAVLPRSIFTPDALADQDLSAALRGAVDLVVRFCTLLGRRTLFVHRPEIFTHGETLAWLHQELGGIEDHLSISDGSNIKLIPGMQNHVFLYAPGIEGHLKDFRELVGRAPEIIPQLGFQVNSAFSFRHGGQTHRPRPLLLQAEPENVEQPADLRRFYLNPSALDSESVGRSIMSAALAPASLDRFSSVTYIPFNDSAIADVPFCRFAAKTILDFVSGPESRLLILGAPPPRIPKEKLSGRMARLLEGIGRADVLIPRAVLANVAIAAGTVDRALVESMQAGSTMFLHDACEFWNFPRAYYGAFDHVSLVLPRARKRDRASLAALLADAIGRAPDIVWTAPQTRGSLDARGLHG